MKIRRLENVMLFTGVISVVLAFLATLFAFVTADDHILFAGVSVFVVAFKTLFSFTFTSAPILLVFVVLAVSVICLLIWLVMLILKRANLESWLKYIVSFVCILVIFTLFTVMFVSKVTFDGRELVLFDALRAIEGNLVVKILGYVSVGLTYLSLMMITLYAFVNVGMNSIIGRNYRSAKITVSNKKNDK